MGKKLEGQLEFDFMKGLESKDRKIIDYIGYGLLITSCAVMSYAIYLEYAPIKEFVNHIL